MRWPVHAASHFIKWHTIKNQEASVAQDVRCIREHPLVPHNAPRLRLCL